MRKAKRFTADGLPIDALDWTEADWQDLHEAIERVKRNVSRRHQRPAPAKKEADQPSAPESKHG